MIRTLSSTTPFLLLTTQRTGSSWVTTLLDSHPNVAAYGELFLRTEAPHPPRGARGFKRFSHVSRSSGAWNLQRPRPLRTFAYLDDLYSSGSRVIGFKLMYDQLVRYPEILAYCVWRHVRVVHLIRANALDIVISRALMRERGFAHAESSGVVKPLRVHLDTRMLYVRLWSLALQVSTLRTGLATLRIPTLEVTYENLVSAPAELRSILDFLGLEADDVGALESPLVRLDNREQSELVENYDSVANTLKKTRFSTYLRNQGNIPEP